MTNRERFQLQFDNCFRKLPVKRLDGIARAAREAEESQKFWTELEKFNQ
jgi:hypothetical protein